MRILRVFIIIFGFMSSTGALGHVHCDLKSEDKHVSKKEHCQHHKKDQQKRNTHQSKGSSCMILCSVCTLGQSLEHSVIIYPEYFLGQITFSKFNKEHPRSYNYRLFRPPIA